MEPVSVIIVTYNSACWIGPCLSSLLAEPCAALRPVVVDNASVDATVDLVEARFPRVRLIRSDRNLGFAGGANLGLLADDADVAVLVNPDVTVTSRAIMNLADALRAHPDAAIAGGQLLFPDGETIQHAGGIIAYPLALADHIGYGQPKNGQPDHAREVEYVTGALLAINRRVLDSIGPFDEGFFPAYYEEVDLCRRARAAGYRVLYVPAVQAVHRESATLGKDSRGYFRYYHRNRLRYVLKHYTVSQLEDDFLPAELARQASVHTIAELSGLRAAIDDNLEALRGTADYLWDLRHVQPIPNEPGRRKALERLAEGASTVMSVEEREAEAGAARLDLLRRKAKLSEPDFTSGAPAIGGLLVGVRRLWNWMSTKWYVRPIIEQQSEFNELAVSQLESLLRRREEELREGRRELRAVERAAIDAERLSVRLQRDLVRLEARLRYLESETAEARSAEAAETRSNGEPSA